MRDNPASLPVGLRPRISGYRQLAGLFGSVLILLLASACQSATFEPPRAATATAQAAQSPSRTPTPLISSAPTATPGGSGLEAAAAVATTRDPAAFLTLWASVEDESELEVLEAGLSEFTDTTGIHVEFVQVAPRLMPELMQSAVISGTLPDLVLHPVEYTHGWAEEGLLDPTTAKAVLGRLGENTFEPGALTQLSGNDEAGSVMALPSTGWQQVLLYRTDWFEELGLTAPETFAELALAAEAINEEDSPISGLIVPTDSALVSTQQIFEQLAVANGCRLVSQEGEIVLLHPACLAALEFYRSLINANSPIGLQTDISALNGYLSGRTGIIIASPAVLPAIAGLSEDARPTCPECVTPDYLANNTGIVTTLLGDSEFAQPANFAVLTALGITSTANKEAAASFAEYWFEDLYPEWIATAPERKVPLRWGTQDDETLFLEVWSEAPLSGTTQTLADVYGPDAAAQLSQDIASASRWGLANGQGSLLSTLYKDLLLAPLLQDMLSGYFNSSETIVEMYLLAVDAVPDYAYPIQVAPTPTP